MATKKKLTPSELKIATGGSYLMGQGTQKKPEVKSVKAPGLAQGIATGTVTPASAKAKKSYPNQSGEGQAARYQAEQAAARRAQQYDNAFGNTPVKAQTRGQITSTPSDKKANVRVKASIAVNPSTPDVGVVSTKKAQNVPKKGTKEWNAYVARENMRKRKEAAQKKKG